MYWLGAAFLAACSEDRVDRRDEPAPTGRPPATDAVVAAARAVLARRVDPRRFGDPAAFDVTRAWVEPDGVGHVRFRQTHRGVPVWGGEIGVHLRADGGVRAVIDRLVPDLDVDPAPDLDATDVAVAWPDEEPDPDAVAALRPPPEPVLWVLRRPRGDHLVWQVDHSDLAASPPTAPRVFVDAHDGAEVWRYENLQSSEPKQTQTRYDLVQTTQMWRWPGPPAEWYPLDETARDYQTLTLANTYTNLYYPYRTADPFDDTAIGSLHWATERTLDYYATVHGRHGVHDGAVLPYEEDPVWAPRVSDSAETFAVAGHYGVAVDNAFWDPVSLLVLTGDGWYFSPLVSPDIVGHELTHAVIQYTAALTYSNESGALNESFADVFGAAVERHARGMSPDVWWIGEDITGYLGWGALRFMDDPTREGGDSRDHYDDRYTGTLDNGGVHWNSGIANLAFYLVSEGGDHPTYGGTAMTGIGFDDAADIWYRALTTYLVSSSDFADARVATILAAEDLFGSDSPEANAVDAAWALVGVNPWILLPTSGWTAGGVGAPAVADSPSGAILAFETQTDPPSAQCPHGEWAIGFATSSGGAWTPGAAEALAPAPSTYRSCVVAHPALVPDSAGGYHLWFKSEQGTDVCGVDEEGCLYTGIGYAHVTAGLLVDSVSAAPVVATTEATGFPSVVKDGSTWRMAYQRYPGVWMASAPAAAGPWTAVGSAAIVPGATPWAMDEVFNPALVCGTGGLTTWLGGRDTAGAFGSVLDGGVGTGTSATGASWTLSGTSRHGFDSDLEWRHWSAATVSGGTLLFYSQIVGGLPRIGLRTSYADADWDVNGLSGRVCP